ncbi:MAG: hypothetical protein RIE08_16880 [Acidimicrobiales bacterium]
MVPPRRVRVLPDVAVIDKTFDYAVPDAWNDGRSARLAVGSMVRVDLHGRRVAAWVTELDPEPVAGVVLKDLSKLSGAGPSAEQVDLAAWIAWRWGGRRAPVLRAMSPHRMVAAPRRSLPGASRPPTDAAGETGVRVVEIPPAGDRWPLITDLVSGGRPLIVVPSVADAGRLARRLRRGGAHVALLPDEWAAAAGGAVVVGSRAAAVGPVSGITSILVLDEHDETLREERVPTWHARDVAVERARRLGIPCVLTSPVPSLEARVLGEVVRPGAAERREGWPVVDTIDPRDDDAGPGTLFTEALVRRLREHDRCLCVLNRTGRAVMLACSRCEEMATCERCDAGVVENDAGDLQCRRCGTQRPVICTNCGATKIRRLRLGVSRVREDLQTLLREPVGEVTASSEGIGDERVLVGTEAVLHRLDGVDLVAFLDFDQELLATRYRAAEEALGLIARAARLVGGRGGGGRVFVQSRRGDDPVLEAARRGDPSVAADADMERRRELGFPPFSADAEVSGEAAAEFVARLGSPLGVAVMGPLEDRWLLRGTDHAVLADAIAAVERPGGRLRIAVDPPRV